MMNTDSQHTNNDDPYSPKKPACQSHAYNENYYGWVTENVWEPKTSGIGEKFS